MSAFDDLTLAEVELITKTCLGGKAFGDDGVDQFMIAGGVMWATKRRDTPELSWPEFKSITRMSDIKGFAATMEDDETTDPTQALKRAS